MKMLLHDAYRTFDLIAFTNRVFDTMINNDLDTVALGKITKLSPSVLSKFFAYKTVSLPTLLILAEWSCTNLAYFIVWQD